VTILSADAEGIHATAERRILQDRRRRRLHALFVGGIRGRRRRVRREEAGGVAAVDWYPARTFAAVLLILLLCCIDSFNTLVLLGRGFIELNPLMRGLIDSSGAEFALIKLGLTAFSAIALIVLTRAKAFGRYPAGKILYAAALAYAALVGYEFWMLGGITQFD
jgi:hypothetical protein